MDTLLTPQKVSAFHLIHFDNGFAPECLIICVIGPGYSVTPNRSISSRKSLFNADYFIWDPNYTSFEYITS